MRSRFWLEVLGPELEDEIQWADDHADGTTDPWVRYGTVDYRKALRNIKYGWLKLWSIPQQKASSSEEQSGEPLSY